MTPEQLGLDQKDPKVLRLPQGLTAVGESWFEGSDIEKLVVPSSVTRLGISAFAHCDRLREVVFKPGSRLEIIDKYCFSYCWFKSFTVPRSVRCIEEQAFYDCERLSSIHFKRDG